MKIPDKIYKIIGEQDSRIDTVGKSESQVICYRDMVLKIEEQGVESDNERRMMAWLDGRLPVPKILCAERENNVNYLLMSRMPGEMCCSEPLMERPDEVVRALAQGLKMLWAVSGKGCPSNRALDRKLELAEYRVGHGLCGTEDVEAGTYGPDGFSGPEELLQWLQEHRPPEDLVFSHGDYCLPNVFVKNREISGFIDLGRSGIADRYQDLAICYRSLRSNFSGAYGGKVYKDFDPLSLFEALKIPPDWEKIKYYILMDELF